MIRTLTIALTVFVFCSLALYADDPQKTPSDAKTILAIVHHHLPKMRILRQEIGVDAKGTERGLRP